MILGIALSVAVGVKDISHINSHSTQSPLHVYTSIPTFFFFPDYLNEPFIIMFLFPELHVVIIIKNSAKYF